MRIDADLTNLRGFPEANELVSLEILDDSSSYAGDESDGPSGGLKSLAGLPSSLDALHYLSISGQQNLAMLDEMPPELPALEVFVLDGNDGLENFFGMSRMPNLRALAINSSSMTSMLGLPRELNKLSLLDLKYNTRLQSLQGLPELPALRELNLASAGIASLKGLPSDMPSLRAIDLSHANDLKDFDWWPQTAPLKDIDLYSMKGEVPVDLAALTRYAPTLTELHLGPTLAINYDAVAELYNLTYLDLEGAQVSSLAFLSGLKTLKELDYSDHDAGDMTSLLPLLPENGGSLTCLYVDFDPDPTGANPGLSQAAKCDEEADFIARSSIDEFYQPEIDD